ncbi:Integral membrane protein [Venustampulla echinocandica]|uniref:Integral membrane protein n=1 Tax=Venustampulla echinocandica TaxID=2656787 RepID=A0A370TDD3_9HELO|nr:Integral membrane protein [Venustampulla echinocandica]RDL32444.1 Integral membrane protein [Venustampulla echinocandica]
MRPTLQKYTQLTGALLLGLALVASVHGHGHGDDTSREMDMGQPSISRPTLSLDTVAPEATAGPQSYFQYGEYSGWIVAHIVLMTIGWVFVLPIGVMLSLAQSHYSLPMQFVFLAINAVGVLLATIYNASTPDLYPNNAHHKLGWILTWVISAHVLMGLVSAYAGRREDLKHEERGSFIQISTAAMEEHQRLHGQETFRYSNDSGQGTEPDTERLRSHSTSSTRSDQHQLCDVHLEREDEYSEKEGLIPSSRIDRFFSRKIPGLLSARALRVMQLAYGFIDRVILIMGFIGIATGIVTYGGLFMGAQIFSGLAHWIKGGVFFWYGILTLGRWAGSFADIGWAWNINLSRGSRRPTAEFVESLLIFIYGSTNIFLEHLAAWGNEWSAQDLEHISITVMFIGGGACGMLVESKRIRDLLNTTSPPPNSHLSNLTNKELELLEPKSYRFSMNPIPALIILLLGLMMSSHHQHSMFSSMIHQQWGILLVGAAFARAATYIISYISPPTSVLPGRPPTELITAFCLMAGGLIFMVSSHDTVTSLESYDLDAMFVFTVSMGVITLLMAWIILVIAIKGWALKIKGRSATNSTFVGYRRVETA